MYCWEEAVRYSELDADGQMSLSSVLNRLQDCCIFDSEEIGVGLKFLKQEQRAWVLSFWQVVICRYPGLGEHMKTFTWPYDFKGFFGYRNFKAEDEAGEVIAYANSIWTYLDTQTGTPARVPKEVQKRYVFAPPYEMEHAERKILLEKDMQQKEPVRAMRSLMDTNQHVNNGKYVMLAEEYLPPNFKVREIRAEYKKSAVLSDFIYPKVKELDSRYIVSLENEASEPYAIVEFREEHV